MGAADQQHGPIIFKKGKIAKRRQRNARADDSDDGGDAVIKKRSTEQRGAIRVTSKSDANINELAEVYAGTGEIQERGDMGATRINEEETERSMDQRSQREAFMNDQGGEEGKYHGMRGYKDWKQVRSMFTRVC
jgi:hypothetical protein